MNVARMRSRATMTSIGPGTKKSKVRSLEVVTCAHKTQLELERLFTLHQRLAFLKSPELLLGSLALLPKTEHQLLLLYAAGALGIPTAGVASCSLGEVST